MHYSIIIPSFGRAERLKHLIEVLSPQLVQCPNGEIIIVDDGNFPALETLPFENKANTPLKFVRSNRVGPARARNLGAANASGDILFFIDDDCLPPEDWIEFFMKKMREQKEDLMGGAINNLIDRPASVIYQRTLELFFKHKGAKEFLLTGNMVCRKEVFLAVKGFDERFFHGAEDREFVLKVSKRGFSVRFYPESVVSHFHIFSHLSLWKHTYMQSKGSYILYAIISKEEQYSISRLPIKVYLATAFAFLDNPGGLTGIISCMSFIIMQMFSVTGFVYSHLLGRITYAKKRQN
ncbi:MAG: glycosyltransferase [Ignavibacteriales bacterium]|nr:glycosyltransferase [Ignavibacteriales bacterium]